MLPNLVMEHTAGLLLVSTLGSARALTVQYLDPDGVQLDGHCLGAA
jgi:hypothetical protein